MILMVSLYFLCFSFILFLATMFCVYYIDTHTLNWKIKRIDNFLLNLLLISGFTGSLLFVIGIIVAIVKKIMEVL